MCVQNILLPIVYKIYSRKPINNKLVVFADAHHQEIPYSMKLMKDKFDNTDFQIEECYTDYQSKSYINVIYEMIKFIKLYAACAFGYICTHRLWQR